MDSRATGTECKYPSTNQICLTRNDNMGTEFVVEQHDGEFKQPPREDCPICFIRMPTLGKGTRYQSCCGKVICCGCIHAPVYDDKGNKVAKKCPFCRVPTPDTDEEGLERDKKRVEAGDALAIYNLGCDYEQGINGYPQDCDKALKLYHRAAELGHAEAYGMIGYCYDMGRGVEVSKKKAKWYLELAAAKGDVTARYNLGLMEYGGNNMDRAVKHYMMAVGSGDAESLKEIQELYSHGHATKDDYAKALRLYQEYLGEIKSVQRDKAAAAKEEYRYY